MTTIRLSDGARRTIRTVVQLLIGLAVLVPLVVTELDLGTAPAVGMLVAVCTAITRVMAMPAVEVFLQRWAPWLAAYEALPDTSPKES